MVRTFKENVIIGPGGLIEIHRPDLPEGAAAEVVITIELAQPEPAPLSNLLGKAHSGYASGEDADAFVRAERDAWDR
jgi:hypothetical protein